MRFLSTDKAIWIWVLTTINMYALFSCLPQTDDYKTIHGICQIGAQFSTEINRFQFLM